MLSLKYIRNRMYFPPNSEREREILYFHDHPLILLLVSIWSAPIWSAGQQEKVNILGTPHVFSKRQRRGRGMCIFLIIILVFIFDVWR